MKKILAAVTLVVLAALVWFVKQQIPRGFWHRHDERHLAILNSKKSPLESSRSNLDETVSAHYLKLLLAHNADLKVSQGANTYFQAMYSANPEIRSLYTRSAIFFEGTSGGLDAARFIALMPILKSDPFFAELMTTTQSEIKSHSGAILEKLKTIDHPFKEDPFMDQALMNLSLQIEASNEEKLLLLSRVGDQKIEIGSNGQLSSSATNVETSLILMNEVEKSSAVAGPYVRKILESNQDPTTKAILRKRVVALYPDLAYMFE